MSKKNSCELRTRPSNHNTKNKRSNDLCYRADRISQPLNSIQVREKGMLDRFCSDTLLKDLTDAVSTILLGTNYCTVITYYLKVK